MSRSLKRKNHLRRMPFRNYEWKTELWWLEKNQITIIEVKMKIKKLHPISKNSQIKLKSKTANGIINI